MPATFTFNGVNKIIGADTTGSFDVSYLYSRWKDWVLTSDNSKYEQAFRFVGGDPTVGGKSLGITYFFTNNWVFQPYSEDHRLQINGNLFTDSGDSPFIPASGSFSVTIESSVSNLTDAQILLSEQQKALDYTNGYITYDTLAGVSGSSHPIGTPSEPVNNINQALTIANLYGYHKIFLRNNVNFTSQSDISNFVIEGLSSNIILNMDGCIVNNTSFKNLTVTGNPQ